MAPTQRPHQAHVGESSPAERAAAPRRPSSRLPASSPSDDSDSYRVCHTGRARLGVLGRSCNEEAG